MSNDGWGSEFKSRIDMDVAKGVPDGKPTATEVHNGWGKPYDPNWASGVTKAAQEILADAASKLEQSDWGTAFPVIPARKKFKAPEVDLTDNPVEVDLSEQPFEFEEVLQAIRVGQLCVHRADDGVKWRVTHVPTLWAFMGAVPANGDWNQQQLLSWCKLVQQNWQDYWKVLTELTEHTTDLTERQRYAADIVKKHCLSTPVQR